MAKLVLLGKLKEYIKQKEEYFIHETKRIVLRKFLLVAFIFIVYCTIIFYKYGMGDGIYISILTWSFFVLCTPIADAGFLLDFPMRLITNTRMLHTEILVWTLAILINVYSLIFNPEIYSKFILLTIFNKILIHPWPFYSIIFISGMGTFLSVYFGDELIDVAKHEEKTKYKKHRNKYKLVLVPTIIIATIILYYILLSDLGIIIGV